MEGVGQAPHPTSTDGAGQYGPQPPAMLMGCNACGCPVSIVQERTGVTPPAPIAGTRQCDPRGSTGQTKYSLTPGELVPQAPLPMYYPRTELGTQPGALLPSRAGSTGNWWRDDARDGRMHISPMERCPFPSDKLWNNYSWVLQLPRATVLPLPI